MNVPINPGREPITINGRPLGECIDELMEEIELASRHGVPSTSNGRTTSNPKPQKTQIAQRTSKGTVLPRATAKLWGIFSGQKGKKS